MDIKLLEGKYLRAKIAYYEGDSNMSDSEFDMLEKVLKDCKSKVIEQVGSKRKDFDFDHSTRMLSLSKIQTESTPTGTNYNEEDFLKWYNKNKNLIGRGTELLASPKFDGNAINITFKGDQLFQVTTRGDGTAGKDITKRFSNHLPEKLITLGLDLKETDIVQIRAEVVIKLSIFDEKYKGEKEDGKFANARNYVAGVIGKDDYDETKVSELDILPVHYLLNGEQTSQHYFKRNIFAVMNWDSSFLPENYIQTIKSFETLRKDFKYLLDGVVIAFPVQYREELGENDHDPEWSVAIKFVPEETITTYNGIEWSISKRGEIIPVILLEPIQLAGTTVKRASGYNAGYIVNNKIGPGSHMSLAKAGDIIPEVQKVTIPSDKPINLPTHCPSCQTELVFDSTHLKCQNENCEGRIAKKLESAAKVIGIKGVGGKTLEPFAKDFKNMIELWAWVLESGHSKDIEKYGIEYRSRSHEIFADAFDNIKSMDLSKIIMSLGYENVGKTLSRKLAGHYCGLEEDFSGLEKALVEKMKTQPIINHINFSTSILEEYGVKIDKPVKEAKELNLVGVSMTGSPKSAGYKTKKEFLDKFIGINEVSLTDKACKYLITDSYDSKSSKMAKAKKKGIEIRTYGDFKI